MKQQNNHAISRGDVVMPAAGLPFVMTCLLLAQEQGEPAANELSREEMQFLKDTVAGLKLCEPPNRMKFLPVTANPVLGPYNNTTGASRFGATFLWLSGERPVGAVSVSIRRTPANGVYCECSSFWPRPLECQREGMTAWTPERAGVLEQPFGDAAAPATSKPRRLTQMRDLARRFSVTSYRSQPEEPNHLRLLATPLHRFAAEEDGIIDGGVFAFATATDPDALLLIEAAREKPDAAAYWRYSLARMSSQKAVFRLDDKEIWSVTNYHRESPQTRIKGPYMEQRIGTFVPLRAAENTNQQ
jgi:hypothetical protein